VVGSGPADCTGAENLNVTTSATNLCELGAGVTRSYRYAPSAEFYPRFKAFLEGTGALQAGGFVCKSPATNGADCNEHGRSAVATTWVDSKFGSYCRVNCLVAFGATDYSKPAGTAANRGYTIHAARSSVNVDGLIDIPDYKEGIITCREQVDPCLENYESGAIGAIAGYTEAPGPVDGYFWAYPTGYFYQYYDQYLYLSDLMRDALALGLASILVSTFLFTLSVRSSLCLVIVILMSVVELIGVIPESSAVLPDPGLRLNAFSLVNIISAVGLSVEWSSYILSQFINEPSTGLSGMADRDARVINAMTFMGPPIVHASITTIISICFLATNALGFIREYYFFMFFIMVLIGNFNGLVVLPVLLSLLGDEPIPYAEDSTVETDPGRKSLFSLRQNNPNGKKEAAFGF